MPSISIPAIHPSGQTFIPDPGKGTARSLTRTITVPKNLGTSFTQYGQHSRRITPRSTESSDRSVVSEFEAERSEPDAQSEIPSHHAAARGSIRAESYGIGAGELEHARSADTSFEHFKTEVEARNRRNNLRPEKYELTKRTITDDQGNAGAVEHVYLRKGQTRNDAARAVVGSKLKDIQTGLNIGRAVVEKHTGMTRKTGSAYSTRKGKEDLLTSAKQVPVDYSSSVQAGLKMGLVGAAGVAGIEKGLSEGVLAAASAVIPMNAVQSVADGVFAVDAHSKLRSDREKAKAKLVLLNDAERFRKHLGAATPQEAEAYLDFCDAAGAVFKPTQEQSATAKAARHRAMRAGVATPLASAAALGAHVGNALAPLPGISAVAAPFTIAAGVIDIREGRQEELRRVDQRARATERKAGLQAVLERAGDHEEFDLLQGVVSSLVLQQDRLIRQADREIKFARVRVFRGGAVAAGTLAQVGAVAAIAATTTAATVASAGLALIGPVLIAAGGTTAVAIRNHKRAIAESKSKWRQRGMRAAEYSLGRQQLFDKLRGKDGNPLVQVEQQEGEFLAREGRFAGKRAVEFDVRENEYAGLRALAYEVQDLVEHGRFDAHNPFMQVLDVCGVDKLKLLAICKAASGKKANVQLDFIASRLAPHFGMKLRMSGDRQALPHISVFLDHLRAAETRADEDLPIPYYGTAHKRYDKVYEKLSDVYGGEALHLQDFENAIRQHLAKTKHLLDKHDPAIRKDELKELAHFLTYLETSRLTNRHGTSPVEQGAGPAPMPASAPTDQRFESSGLKSVQVALTAKVEPQGMPMRAVKQREIEAEVDAVLSTLESFDARLQDKGARVHQATSRAVPPVDPLQEIQDLLEKMGDLVPGPDVPAMLEADFKP
ncbi:hypothetical protein [Variovorax sp. KK3]|uniref:hypothetical protein n=1 Tax=Variovorax sp. KK3 TaxID=1855728 RepID=UPI00097C8D77|nr:hypothetical protein [Variovorax sp. KK3]